MNKKKRIVLAFSLVALMACVVFAYANSNMNPKITYTGNGVPDNNTGREGDLYVDLLTNVLYVFKSGTWQMFAVLPNVVNGTNGFNGATWIFGTTEPPAVEQGFNGDFYLDITTWNVYNKSNGTWTLLGCIQGIPGKDGTNGLNGKDGIDGINGTDGRNGTDGVNGTNGVDGKDGIDGTDGKAGSVWYNDLAYTLTDGLGVDGDYFMFANGTVEYKMNGTWVFFTSLLGPKGDTGQTGPTGDTGATGATGETGATGPQGEPGIQGVPGKDGINGTNGAYGLNGINGQDGVVPWWLYAVVAVALGASLYSVDRNRRKPKTENVKISENAVK